MFQGLCIPSVRSLCIGREPRDALRAPGAYDQTSVGPVHPVTISEPGAVHERGDDSSRDVHLEDVCVAAPIDDGGDAVFDRDAVGGGAGVSDEGAVGHVGGVGDVHLQESSGGKVADHEEVALGTSLTAHAVQESGAGGRQRAQFLAGHNVVGADDVVLDDKQGASQNFHAVGGAAAAKHGPRLSKIGSRQNAASVAHKPPVAVGVVFGSFDGGGGLGMRMGTHPRGHQGKDEVFHGKACWRNKGEPIWLSQSGKVRP